MARGRMLDQSFMRSEKLRNVSRDVRLIYASILPFLDREGRHLAEPIVLKATVFRRSDFTLEEVANGINELARAGLIKLYSDADNDAILEYTNFLDFNTPNHKEAKSKFPKPGAKGTGPVKDEYLLNGVQHVVTRPAPEVAPGGAPGGTPGTDPVSSNATERNGTERTNGRGPLTGPPTTTAPQKNHHLASEADRPEGPTAQPEQPDVRLTGIPEVDRYILDTRANAAPDPYKEQLDKILARKVDA